MRKHEEGYSLVLVMVVLIVICLVAVGLMSYSLSNLENQRRAVTRMEEEYKAEGEIEKYAVKLEQVIMNLEPEAGTLEGNAPTYVLPVGSLTIEGVNVEIIPGDTSILVVSQSGTTEVCCKIGFVADSVVFEDEMRYKFQNCTGIVCQSYEINRGVAEE